jgi:putative addiction module component (TIGR02574 family)
MAHGELMVSYRIPVLTCDPDVCLLLAKGQGERVMVATPDGRFPQLRDGQLYGTLVHMIKEKIPELQKLSAADKFALAVELWDELSSNPEEIPVTEEQLNELDRRVEEYRKDPDKVVTWEDAKARILSGRP